MYPIYIIILRLEINYYDFLHDLLYEYQNCATLFAAVFSPHPLHSPHIPDHPFPVTSMFIKCSSLTSYSIFFIMLHISIKNLLPYGRRVWFLLDNMYDAVICSCCLYGKTKFNCIPNIPLLH